MILDLSRASSPSSILTQSSTDSVELNKIKSEITNKKDSFYVKVMKYLTYFYSILVIIFIIFEFVISNKTLNKEIKFLRENSYFQRAKVDSACIYSSFSAIKLIREKFLDDNSCVISCVSAYKELIIQCLNDIENQKKEVYLFENDFLNIIGQKRVISMQNPSLGVINYLNLDLTNWLNVIIASGMKLYSSLDDFLSMTPNVQMYKLYLTYLDNSLDNSFNFFYSNYSGFSGEEKEKRCNKVLL